MINDLLRHPDFVLLYTRGDLAHPFGVREDGTVATVADAIRAFAPQEVREEFSLSPADARRPPIKLIDRHTEDDIARLAIEILALGQPGTALAVSGRGSFTNDQMVDEVRRKTDVGQNQIMGTRLHARLVEGAIRAGKIKPVKAHLSLGPIPLDF